MITGGGTSGHINPALAIADLLKEDAEKNGDSCRIVFTGKKTGLEGELVPKAGYEFRNVEALPLPYKPTPAAIKAIYHGRFFQTLRMKLLVALTTPEGKKKKRRIQTRN